MDQRWGPGQNLRRRAPDWTNQGVKLILDPKQKPKIHAGPISGGQVKITRIAAQFLTFLWPAFLFNGLNILASAYLTSTQRPMQSAFIAFSRGFALPAAFLLMLPIGWEMLGSTSVSL